MRRVAFAVLLLLTAGSAAAQEPAQFFIERIEVRNASRVSADVVIAESRLRTGAVYTEAQMREASDRVNRQPFLLSADFALEKGSDRGRYVLVISVVETKIFFAQLDIRPYLGHATSADYTAPLETSENDIALGFRFFVGRRGAIHLGIIGSDDNRDYVTNQTSFAVGYTQYDLFGTRAFATLNLKKPIGSNDTGHISPQVVVGIPVSLTQTVTLLYDRLELSRESNVYSFGPFERRLEQSLFSATWSRNTTNRPFLPTRGTLLTVTPTIASSDRKFLSFDVPNGNILYTPQSVHERSAGLEAAAARYWEVSDRNSVSAALQGGWARTNQSGTIHDTIDSSYGFVTGRISHSLFETSEIAKNGDSRLEAELRLGYRARQYPIFTSAAGTRSVDVRQVNASWVRRNAWGTFRFGLGYAW
jgi:outer membrane protein assembly factor BamA